MAENEFLDLDDAYGRRWDILFQSIRKNEPSTKWCNGFGGRCTVDSATPETVRGIRHHIKMLVEHRNSRLALRQFARTTLGHDYVHSLARLRPRLRTLIQRVCSRLCWSDLGRRWGPDRLQGCDERWASEPQWDAGLPRSGRIAVLPDVDRIARKLAEDPSWKLRMPAGTNDQQADSTPEMLSMSLLRNQ